MMAMPKENRLDEVSRREQELLEERDRLITKLCKNEAELKEVQAEIRDLDE